MNNTLTYTPIYSDLITLFTNEEYIFINAINSNLQKIESKIQDEEKYTTALINLIDTVHKSSKSSSLSAYQDEFTRLILNTENMFQLINTNMDLLSKIKSNCIDIKSSVDNLMKQIQLDNNDILVDINEIYSEQIHNIKQQIQVALPNLQITNDTIQFNINEIIQFLNQDITNKIISYTDEESFSVTSNVKKNNDTLLISEKSKIVCLPYSEKEILQYLVQFPNKYTSFADVVNKEFIFHINYFMKNPIVTRFHEGYSLIRDKESKSALDAFKFAIGIMFKSNLNPAIITACKTLKQFENYLYCLERGNLNDFKDFKISYELNPLKI